MPPFTACAITTSADGPPACAWGPVDAGATAVSDWQRPSAWPHCFGPPFGKLMFLTKVRFSACAESTLTALSVMPASPDAVSAPVALGKNLFPTTPQEP